MLRNSILFFALFLSSAGYSQKNKLDVFYNNHPTGKNYLSQLQFPAIQYIFPEKVYNFHLDSTTGNFTVQLRKQNLSNGISSNKGKFLLYDAKNFSVKWSKKINYLRSEIKQFDTTIIQTLDLSSSLLNYSKASINWTSANKIFFIDPYLKIGLGYRYTKGMNQTSVEATNLYNGRIMWNRKINLANGWEEIKYINDSMVLISSDGVHLLNLKKGTGWDHISQTWKNDYKQTITENAIGLALGVLTGTYFISYGHNVVTGICSNILTDGDYVYFGSKDNLVKIDMNTGKLVWSQAFPEKLASKSFIFIYNNLLYIINTGYANMRYRINFGNPFIAAYSLDSGKQFFFTFCTPKDDPILSYQVKNNEIILLFRKKIAKYLIDDGKLLQEKIFFSKAKPGFQNFLGNQNYFNVDKDTYISLPLSDSTMIYTYTDDNKAMVIDYSLNSIKDYNLEDILLKYESTDKLQFIGNEKYTFVLDSSGKKIAELDASMHSRLLGNKLYDIQDRSILEIDLSGLFLFDFKTEED